MRITLVAAAAENNVIGRDGDLPWHLPDDFKHFKRLTLDHTLVMGRKTFEELGGPLPRRRFIIVSRRPGEDSETVRWVDSLARAFELAAGEKELFVAGGGEIYRQTLELAQRIVLTRVHAAPQGDTHFPDVSNDDWVLCDEQYHPADERHAHAFTIQIWERRSE